MIIFGIDFGTPQGIKIIKQSSKKILGRIPGHTGWYCQGQTKYYGPEFIVLDKAGKGKIVDSWSTFPYDRKTRKEELAKALKYFGEDS